MTSVGHGLLYLTLLFTYRNDNVMENHNLCVMEKILFMYSIWTELPKVESD